MEVDSFAAPLACRIYIDYMNVSQKPVQGVKFRLGYVDREGKVRGTFHAPDGRELGPGAQLSHKWRGEKVDPRTVLVKIRVLTVRYADGTIWESEKMKDVAKPPGADSGGGADAAESSGGTAGPEPGAAEAAGAQTPPPAQSRGSEGL